MKLAAAFLGVIWLARLAHGEETFVYNQQSINTVEGAPSLESGQPLGQRAQPSMLIFVWIQSQERFSAQAQLCSCQTTFSELPILFFLSQWR
jgi:hypothetical protein